jgi:hypothetical protein
MHHTRLLLACLAALLISVPVRAEDRPDDLQRQMEAMNRALAGIRADLELLKPVEASRRLADIESRLRKVEEMLARQDGRPSFYPSDTEIRTISDLLGRLREFDDRMRNIEGRLGSGDGRIARSITPDRPGAMAGSIRLDNTSGLPATVIINGISYRMGPFETRTLSNRPLGAYTYDVDVEGFGTVRSGWQRTLVAGYRDVITIFPPR